MTFPRLVFESSCSCSTEFSISGLSCSNLSVSVNELSGSSSLVLSDIA